MFELGVAKRIDNNEVFELESKIDLAVLEAKEIVVYDLETFNIASNYYSGFGQIKKRLTDLMKVETGPLEDKLSGIKAIYKELIFRFSAEEARLDKQVKAYLKVEQDIANKTAAEERKRREDQAITEALAKEERLKAEAVAKGADPSKVKVEIAIIPEVIEDTPKLASMNTSDVRSMRVSKWRIIDEALIPREYFIVDEKRIQQIRKAAGVGAISNIPGIEYYCEDKLVRG